MNRETYIKNSNPLVFKGIAHRGLHNEEFTENGLKAFQNAIDHNFAFELDVHLTKDNQLIVCHDNDLKRTTGKEGIIEDLTVEEIKRDYKLLDGSEVPTFQEVLALNQERVPIIVELKTWNKNNKPLAQRAIEELKNIKDKRNIVIIAFDPRALYHMRKAGFMRQLLIAKSDQYTFFYRFWAEAIDIQCELLTEKKFMNYRKKHMVNCWTVDKMDEKFEKYYDYFDMATFQFLDTDVVKRRLEEKKVA